MSKGVVEAKAKARKKENAEKKANRKKATVFAWIISLAILAAVTVIFLPRIMERFSGTIQKNEAEVYSHGRSKIELNADGTFSASLPHGVRKNGTYTKRSQGRDILVNFNVNGNIEVGRIENNSLHLPREWDDGHGHGSVFPREGSTQDHGHDHDHDHDHSH